MANEKRGGSSPDISRFTGYKGAWDKELGTFVFVSKEERDRFQIDTYGRVRNGFREPDEPEDDRPMLDTHRCRCKGCREHEGFWRDHSERLMYQDAIEANPKREDEGPMAYSRRISEIVQGHYAKIGKPMPRAHMTRRERDGRLMKLREQARPDLPEWIEDRA